MKRLSILLIVLGVASLVVLAAADPQAEPGRRHLNAPGRSDELPYSHAVLVGDTLYLAGGIGIDPKTGKAPDDVKQEVKLLMDGMKRKLELAGMSMDDLVSVQVFCSDISLYDQFNEIYRTYFKEGFPARAFIGSGKLLRNGNFEIQGIAVRR